jgi:hypothetical protein
VLIDNLIVVKAQISMKAIEDAGRETGFKYGYRLNNVFAMPENLKGLQTYIGDIRFENQELINPGETKIVTVRFLNVPPIRQYIKVGQKWFINEGARTLGYGEILDI